MPKRGKGHKWWDCHKLELSQKVTNWFSKNQNKKNLLTKKVCAISIFFKLVNFLKGAIFS